MNIQCTDPVDYAMNLVNTPTVDNPCPKCHCQLRTQSDKHQGIHATCVIRQNTTQNTATRYAAYLASVAEAA